MFWGKLSVLAGGAADKSDIRAAWHQAAGQDPWEFASFQLDKQIQGNRKYTLVHWLIHPIWIGSYYLFVIKKLCNLAMVSKGIYVFIGNNVALTLKWPIYVNYYRPIIKLRLVSVKYCMRMPGQQENKTNVTWWRRRKHFEIQIDYFPISAINFPVFNFSKIYTNVKVGLYWAGPRGLHVVIQRTIIT